jgi:Tat protein translocase TatC
MKKQTEKASHGGTMSFIEHLDELRSRLLRYLVVLTICVLAAYFFRKEILDGVRSPVDAPLKKYTSVAPSGPDKTGAVFGGTGAYDCTCEEVGAVQNRVVTLADGHNRVDPGGDPAVEANGSDPTGLTVDAGLGSLWRGGLATVAATFDDFIMYFQVLLGRDPSPWFGSEVPVQSEAAVTAGPRLPSETFHLSCRCSPSSSMVSPHSSMVYLGLPELFFAQMKVAIFAGLFVSFPYLLIQIWGFIGPALYQNEKKVFWVFSIFSYFFFIGGALFGYFIVFPFGFDFFLSLTQLGEIMPSLSVGAYLSFALKLLLAFGFIFEMPLVTFILARMGILTPTLMIKQSRVAILVIFVVSAMLTPPDPFTLILMAGPLMVLYLLSILICFVGLNRQKAALRAHGIDTDL